MWGREGRRSFQRQVTLIFRIEGCLRPRPLPEESATWTAKEGETY